MPARGENPICTMTDVDTTGYFDSFHIMTRANSWTSGMTQEKIAGRVFHLSFWTSANSRPERGKTIHQKCPPFRMGIGLGTLLGGYPVSRSDLGRAGYAASLLGWLILSFLLWCRSRRCCYRSWGRYWGLTGLATNDLFGRQHLEVVLSQVFKNAVSVSSLTSGDELTVGIPLVGAITRVNSLGGRGIAQLHEFRYLCCGESGSHMRTSSCFNSRRVRHCNLLWSGTKSHPRRFYNPMFLRHTFSPRYLLAEKEV